MSKDYENWLSHEDFWVQRVAESKTCNIAMEHAYKQMPKENPICAHCWEEDCVVSMDGTCAMTRVYLSVKSKSSKEENKRLRGALREIANTGMERYCASCGESKRIEKQALEAK